MRESLTYIGELEPAVRAEVIKAYEESLHFVFAFTIVLTVCAFIFSFFIKEKSLAK